MQSFRSRMGSVLRRGSFSKDSDHSGNESEQRPPSPNPRKSSDTGSMRLRRKRLSLSFRGRSGTNDTLEHAQMAQQVVADIEAQNAQQHQEGAEDYKKEDQQQHEAEASVGATTDDTKIESPTEAVKVTDKAQDGADCKHEETAVPVVVAEEPVVEEIAVTAPAVVEETPIITHEVDVHVPEPSMWATPRHPRVEGLEESYHVVMNDSPPQPTTSLPVVDVAPSFPEPAPYQTSFSSASAATPDVSYTAPTSLMMPVPHSTRQPLSAIDENHAKVHPLVAAQEQQEQASQSKGKQPATAAVETEAPKEDVNYDADEYVRVMSLFFLLPAVLFLGIPYFFPHQLLEFASL